MPNTPISLNPAVITTSPAGNRAPATKSVDLDSSGPEGATRVVDVTSISTPGGGSVRPTSGYIYPRGTG